MPIWEIAAEWVGDHALAGLIGAFGNQVLYWTNRIRRNSAFKVSILLMSTLYVVTGSGVGHFVGKDIEIFVLTIGIGFAWPVFIQSLDAARLVASRFRQGVGAVEGPLGGGP